MTPDSASRLACFVLVVSVLLVPVMPAQAQDTVRRTPDVASFTEVGFSVPGTVHLRQGEPQSVEVEGPAEVLDRLEIVVEGGTLEIRSETEGSWLDWFGGDDDLEGRVEVYVTAPTIEGLSVAGSGTIVSETPIQNPSLELRNAGSGGFDLEVDTDDLEIQIAGSGTTRLRGRADAFSAEIAGSGDVEGEELRTGIAEASIAGSGDVRLHVTDRLSVQIMGSGNVRYHGDPSVDTSILGSGVVEPIE